MKHLIKGLTSVFILAGWIGTASTATAGFIYDATADFSLSSNPNGVWLYGSMPQGSTSFTAYNSTGNIGGNPANPEGWYDSDLSTLPTIFVNDGGVAGSIMDVGQLGMHPGMNLESSVLRFVAPSSGTAEINWEFFDGDIGAMTVSVLNDAGTSLWEVLDTGSSSLTGYAFTAGETLDFLVGGAYLYGTTPLTAVIDFTAAEVPAPATVALFGLGLAGLGWSRRKKV